MRVLYLNYDFHPSLSSPGALLAEYRGMTSWCAALKDAVEVCALQRYSENAEETREGIRYRFVADGLPPRPGWLHNPVNVHKIAAQERPDVVHLNGKPLFARRLRAHLPGHVAIVWQNHASTIPRIATRWLYRARHAPSME